MLNSKILFDSDNEEYFTPGQNVSFDDQDDNLDILGMEAISSIKEGKEKGKIKEWRENNLKNEGRLDKATAKRIVDTVVRVSGGSRNDALIAMAIAFQLGATSPRQPASNKVDFGKARIVTGKLRDICKEHGTTVRQLARTCNNTVADVMAAMGNDAIRGNLSKGYMIHNPNATFEELTWASDFQTHNPRCPENVRAWLMEDYKAKFRK